jgi:endonuclease YncB( thermonuclease family)
VRYARVIIVAAALVVACSTVTVGQAGPTIVDDQGHMSPGWPVLGQLARVVGVVDGDTIEVDRGQGIETVRYIGIDAPETVDTEQPVQPFGPEASAANERLVGGKWVILESDTSETDADGRLLRYVWAMGDDGLLLVNDALLAQGLADVAIVPPDVRRADLFYATRDAAVAQGAGMWQDGGSGRPLATPGSTVRPAVTAPPLQDLPVTNWDDRVAWRWLAPDEFRSCPTGCIGLLVQTRKACRGGIDVELTMLRGEQVIGVQRKHRGSVGRDRKLRFVFDVPAGTTSGRLTGLDCQARARKATPEPTLQPSASPLSG